MRISRKKLINQMIDKDVNANQLAERAGVSRVTISNIRCGKSCSPITIGKIAKALNVKVEELINLQ